MVEVAAFLLTTVGPLPGKKEEEEEGDPEEDAEENSHIQNI